MNANYKPTVFIKPERLYAVTWDGWDSSADAPRGYKMLLLGSEVIQRANSLADRSIREATPEEAAKYIQTLRAELRDAEERANAAEVALIKRAIQDAREV